MPDLKDDPNSNPPAKADANSSVNRADVSQQERAQMIATLLRERAGYEARADKGGVDAVDAELRRYGHEAATPAKRSERRPAQKNVEKR